MKGANITKGILAFKLSTSQPSNGLKSNVPRFNLLIKIKFNLTARLFMSLMHLTQ